MLKTKPKLSDSILILVTAAILAAVSFLRLHEYADPSGGDGYFYLKQTEWLVKHGQFYHADYSFLFIPLALVAKLTGSPLMAFQFVSCLSYFIILLAVGLIAVRSFQIFSTKQKLFLAMTLMIAFSLQMPVQRLTFEFIKNGFAVALLLSSFILLQRSYLKTALALGALAALAHKTVAIICLLGILVFLVQKSKIKARFIAAVLGFAAIILAFNPRFLKHATNFLNQIRLENITSIFGLNSHLLWSHVLLCLFWLSFYAFKNKKLAQENQHSEFQKPILFSFCHQ